MTGSEWTCARCGVTASFMPGAVDPGGLPANWEALNGISYCLGCLRKLAGEAKAAALSDDDSPADRVRADAEGRIEFELGRDADRCDTRIARASGTNVLLVRQIRERLGVYPTRPV
ncbi:MAG TPA: hypothetical protein VKA41_11195 [Solirubrobacterales bacterium]|nr:hypothetical protein [Solirubrobacterales bacterium]